MQRRLFTGMDCLPGQLDLFDTDGFDPQVKRAAPLFEVPGFSSHESEPSCSPNHSATSSASPSQNTLFDMPPTRPPAAFS